MATPLEQLRSLVEAEMDLMTAVATGGPAIKAVNNDYRQRRQEIRRLLQQLGLSDPNPHVDLWAWYGKWSRDLPTYQSRREYIRDMYAPLLREVEALETENIGSGLPGSDLTGWDAVDGQVAQLHIRLAACETSEDAQAVGLLCRDIMISLADAVHDPEEHGDIGKGAPDRLNAVVDAHASGPKNATLRKLLKTTIDYANVVQHRRDGELTEAGLVAEATVAAVNLVRRLVGDDGSESADEVLTPPNPPVKPPSPTDADEVPF